jgi:hypothetical protein
MRREMEWEDISGGVGKASACAMPRRGVYPVSVSVWAYYLITCRENSNRKLLTGNGVFGMVLGMKNYVKRGGE